jgi:ABC-type nitrate/sulfonate/bicarbonate transport system substrate-binding protein
MFSTRFWYSSATITIILAIHLVAFPARGQESHPVASLKGLKFFNSDREGAVKIMAKYMSIPYEAALRTYDTSIPVFVSDGMLSEDFQDKVLDFEFNAMSVEKKLPRSKVFDFSIMKSLATK